MIYGSVCSGIEAATMAWHPLGWTPAFFSEIEPFPSAVLAHHYGSDPDNLPGRRRAANGVPNYGDMTKFEEWPDHAIDLLVGGTPCQSFSVAGLRAGLDDARGNLMLTYAAIARRYRPRWLVWENVPGVFSSDEGRDFASLLGLLSGRRVQVPADGWRNAGIVEGYEGAYGLAWRVLDAQYVRIHGFERAVPQRRRRVFVVGYLADWRRAAAVLFEPEGMCGDPPPRRKAGKGFARDVAHCLVSSGRGVERTGDTRGQDNVVAAVRDVAPCLDSSFGRLQGQAGQDLNHGCGHLIAESFGGGPDGGRITGTVSAKWAKGAGGPAGDEAYNLVAHALRGEGFDASEDGSGRGTPLVPIAFDARQRDVIQYGDATGPLDTCGYSMGVQQGWAVRRLTPRECERLQGFPDDFTNVPWRGKPTAPDGPRYKALGNSMAVNCMRWIGQRIQMVAERIP